jgi:exodeoxyribonuclease-5
MTHQLNNEQQAALASINSWLDTSSEPFFILSGSAGTGKTFCIRELVEVTRGRFIFTAPTNKATKVLRESVTREDYKPECRTIFSLLGLRLEANDKVKELKAPEDPIDLSQYKAVIVDEGSMVSKVLFEHIKQTAEQFRIKFLFLGDPAQLPPVGELRSPIWDITLGSKLLTVMRHDNQILELATRLRAQVDRFAPTIKLEAANAEGEGIWKLAPAAFTGKIVDFAKNGNFSKPAVAKVIAWRNVEVDRFNKLIRDTIFPNPQQPWLVGDRVLFTSPARDLDDEPVASTDDEGEVTRVDEEYHGVHGEFKIYRIAITLDDNRPVIARVLHPDSLRDYTARVEQLSEYARVEQLSEYARANSRKWKDFWEFKDSFHQLRHAYAITAHRAQGSTYKTAFVYWQDILLNRNRQEAYRCLYVACTRPSKQLILS